VRRIARLRFTGLATVVGTLRRSLLEAYTMLRSGTFASYHPERHYMRGPGPKCHEKIGSAGALASRSRR